MADFKYRLMLAPVLIILTLALYIRVIQFDFLIMDDQVYVTANEHVQQGLNRENLRWAFTNVSAGFWHPITWLSLMLDTTLYGVAPAGYHFTNLFLHIASVTLLFLTFDLMTNQHYRSFIMAALFALHPLHVEVVTWIAERKEALCGFFWIAALYSYAKYVRKPGIGWYGIMILTFLLGIMSKSMIVTLPFALLLIDVWPLRRWQWRADEGSLFNLLAEKVPLLMLSALSAGLTVYAQQTENNIIGFDAFSLSSRLVNAMVSYKIYLLKTFFPFNLSVFYPFRSDIPVGETISALVLLTGISFLAIISFLRQKPYVLIGWCWFLGTLVPVIGIVKIGDFAMADRFMYMPITGLIFASIWLVADMLGNQRAGKILFVIFSAASVIFAGSTAHNYLTRWRDNETLFSHAAEASAPNFLAHNALGHIYMGKGRMFDAERQFQIAVSIRPDKHAIRLDLGRIIGFKGRFVESMVQFQLVLKKNSENPEAHYYMGLALLGQNRRSDALTHFIFAVEDAPRIYSVAHDLQDKGQIGRAMELLQIDDTVPAIKKSMAMGYNYWQHQVFSAQEVKFSSP